MTTAAPPQSVCLFGLECIKSSHTVTIDPLLATAYDKIIITLKAVYNLRCIVAFDPDKVCQDLEVNVLREKLYKCKVLSLASSSSGNKASSAVSSYFKIRQDTIINTFFLAAKSGKCHTLN